MAEASPAAAAGYEVAQLYITDCVCRITPFVRRLRGIEKVWLEPGETKRVTFSLGFEDFAFVNEKMLPDTEPGEFKICVGDLETRFFLLA